MTPEEFKSIIMPIQAKLYNIALCITGNRDDAMDSLQEALIRIWNLNSLLAASDNPAGYCTVVLKNQCIDLIRRRHTTENIDSLAIRPTDDNDISAQVEMRDELSAINHAIAELPQAQRIVLRLSVYGQCDNAEIASITGMSDQNVRTSLSRARRKLRELFSDKNHK